VHYPRGRSLFLYCILGLMTSLLSCSSALVTDKATELSRQNSQAGIVKACIDQNIELGAPQLTDADLKALASCSSEVLPQLLEALKSQNWKIKVVATHTLGLFGAEAQSAIPALSNLLQDENADVRFVVAQALGQIGSEASVPALTKALQDKDENVRVSAAQAFQQVGIAAKSAKSALIDALWDRNWFVRSRTAKVISSLGLETTDIPNVVEPFRNNPERHNGAIVSLMLAIYPPVRGKLEDLPLFFIAGLNDKDPKVRESSALALGQIILTRPSNSHGPRSGISRIDAVPIQDAKVDSHLADSRNSLIKAVQDQDAKVRHSAAQALGGVGGTEAERARIEVALLGAIQDGDASVRKAAIESLRRHASSEKVISALLLALRDQDANARQSATDALEATLLSPRGDSQKISSALIKSLSDEDGGIRQYAADALKKKPDILLPALIELMQKKEQKTEIRYSAIKSLWSSHLPFGSSLNYSQSNKAVALLNQLMLKDPDLGIRQQAAIALINTGKNIIHPKAAVTLFTEGLNSKDLSIQFDAITGIQAICPTIRNDKSNGPCIDGIETLPLLVNILKNDIKPLRYNAALAIAKIHSKEEVEINTLREMVLKERNIDIGGHARSALERDDSQKAVSALAEIASEWLPGKLALCALSCTGGVPSAFVSSEIKIYDQSKWRNSFLPKWSSILANSSESKDSPVVKSIFRLKNQNLRRDLVYSLRFYSLRWRPVANEENLQLERDAIKILTSIKNNKSENLDIRWMAATSLQEIGSNENSFFAENNLINPVNTKCQYAHTGHVEGLSFDVYAGQCTYNTMTGCGDGLSDVYNYLRDFLPKKR
jgi:HEAT repeat protein